MAAVGPVAGLASALFGIDTGHPAVVWLFPVLVSAALLGVTWAALRVERGGLGSLGLVPTRRRAAEFGAGFAVAAGLFAVVALVRAASVGADWTFDLASGARAALIGLPLAFVLMFSEELLFRGYAFRKAEKLWGAPVALVGSSLLFGAYHVVGSGYWGAGALFLFAMPALGGLVFGLAALRTGGLALPLGLHLGGNWVGASVLGLGVPEGAALWAAPVDAAQAAWLMAPDLLPRLPYIAGVALLAVAVLTWPRRHRQVAA
jgi:membrane protease YdiL (CAAX protease family)